MYEPQIGIDSPKPDEVLTYIACRIMGARAFHIGWRNIPPASVTENRKDAAKDWMSGWNLAKVCTELDFGV